MQHVAHGVLTAPGGMELPQRLTRIFDGLERIIDEYGPGAAAIEKVFTARSVRSALVLGQARGMALLALSRSELPIGEYAPSEIKLALTGSGRATKDQLAAMVGRLLGVELAGTSRDATDALAIAICHAHGLHRQRLVQRARSGGR
jgi:crossover junction endodeoxyribonuclease RuvC